MVTGLAIPINNIAAADPLWDPHGAPEIAANAALARF